MDDEHKPKGELSAELRLLRAKLEKDNATVRKDSHAGLDGTVGRQDGFFTAFQMAPIPMAVSAVEDGRFLAVSVHFLQKPFTRDTLSRKIREALDSQREECDPRLRIRTDFALLLPRAVRGSAVAPSRSEYRRCR